MRKPLALACLALAAGGCVRARATLLVPERQPAVPVEDVRYFLTEGEIPAACEPYAVIHGLGAVSTSNQTIMLDAVRERAAAVGANGVLVRPVQDPATSERVESALAGVTADRRNEMVAYRCP